MCWAWQVQGSQPWGPPRCQKRGAQWLQSCPCVWGQQGHCPLTWLQKEASAQEGHRAGTVPWGSQLQPGDEEESEEGEPTHLPWDVLTHPSHTLTTAAPWMQGTGMEARPAVGKAHSTCRYPFTVGYPHTSTRLHVGSGTCGLMSAVPQIPPPPYSRCHTKAETHTAVCSHTPAAGGHVNTHTSHK